MTDLRPVEAAISESLGRAVQVRSNRSVSGGCINDSQQIELDDGSRWFLKRNSDAPADMFSAEAVGLEHMRAAGGRTPEVVAAGEDEAGGYLVLEWIETGRPARDFEERIGRQLAHMHLAATQQHFGFCVDNYLGATPQPNPQMEDWVAFWREHRLEHQLRLAVGYGEPLQQLGRRLVDRLDDYLSVSEDPPALLHGDLWSGNYFADSQGQPVLIDPACYFGRREAEFGMITLFGGLGDRFYASYEELAPFDDGYEQRIAIYRLHHLLNHLNLFGSSYLSQCVGLLQRL